MQPLPHLYNVQANSTPDSQIITSSQGIPDLVVAGPSNSAGPATTRSGIP